MNNYIFLYGTLKKGFSNPISDELKKYIDYYKEGWVFGELYEINNYPGLVLKPEGEKVFGEIYYLKNRVKAIELIDSYEEIGIKFNNPNEYLKKIIPVFTNDREILCLTYLYNWPVVGKHLIKSGNY